MQRWWILFILFGAACRAEPVGEVVECRTSDDCAPGERCLDSVCQAAAPGDVTDTVAGDSTSADTLEPGDTTSSPDSVPDSEPQPDTDQGTDTQVAQDTAPETDTDQGTDTQVAQDTAQETDASGPVTCTWDQSLWDQGCVFGP